MAIILNGTTGITNDGGYTGDGVVFADTTPANTLVTTTSGNVGMGTSSPASLLDVSKSGDSILSITSAGIQRYQLITRSGGRFDFQDQSAGATRWSVDQNGNLFSYKTQQITTNTSATYGTATFYTRLSSSTSYTIATGTSLSQDSVVTATLEYVNLYSYADPAPFAYGLRQAALRGSTSGSTTAGNASIVNQVNASGATAPTFAWTGTSTISLTVTNSSSNEGWARVTVTWRNVVMSLNPVA